MSKSRRRYATWILFFLSGLIPTVWVAYGPVLSGLGHILIYEDASFDRVDLAVVPPGSVPDRIMAAADLLLESKAERIVLTRNPESRDARRLAELGISLPDHLDINRMVLIKKGVPTGRIVELPGTSSSTWEDARLLRDYLKSKSLKSVVIVTCRYHSHRAYLNYNRALAGLDIRVYSMPSRYCWFEPETWWKDREAIVMAYVELAKLGAFYFGWV